MATNCGESSLKTLMQTSPPSYLTPSPPLSRHARIASRQLYSSLFSSSPNPKPPLEDLLIDDIFDAEQIWCQIDLLSRAVISLLKKEIRKIERDPPEFGGLKNKKNELEDEDVEDADVVDDEEEEDEEEKEAESEDGEEQEDMEEERIEEDGNNAIEDEFFKVNELEKFLVKDEEREFGSINGGGEKKNDDDEDDDDDDKDGIPLDLLYGGVDVGLDEDHDENARYEDFWGDNKKRGGEKKNNIGKEKSYLKNLESNDEPEEGSDDEPEEDSDDEPKEHSSNDGKSDDNSDAYVQENKTLSTHEKEQLKIQAEIEKREKANLDPKAWTMQGEVTAAKRPKNSALEVDLDFQHNMKPPPVVTEEFTASIEDLVKQRIIEGNFDDVQNAPALPSKAPKELKELDENKSKKGLAELYEEEYAQQTGLAAAPPSSLDVDKNEATMLFKKLCLKLDALSHFYFAPKPVIEEMSIQSNVPALAMEEIAPVAVSDAAMLAPEEIFKGKGAVKEEAELTQEERKRRRASKKRKFKARKAKSEATKKARLNAATSQLHDIGAEES